MSELFSNGLVDRSPGTLLALGDCNTKGDGDGQSIVHHAAKRLKAAGLNYESVNWGQAMTTTREGVARIEQGCPDVDIAILNYGLVDSWVTTVPKWYISYFPETPAKRLARKLLKSTKRRLRSPSIQRWIPRGEVVPLDEYDGNMRRMIRILNQVNPLVKVVLWPTANVQDRTERNANIDRYNARLRTIAQETHCLLIETAAILRSLTPAACFKDPVHLSNESYRCLGVAIADALLPQLERMPAGQSLRAAA